MSVNARLNWSDPNTCPFCGSELADPGAGFIDHIDASPECESGFDVWKDNVAGDLGGEWSG